MVKTTGGQAVQQATRAGLLSGRQAEMKGTTYHSLLERCTFIGVAKDRVAKIVRNLRAHLLLAPCAYCIFDLGVP
jgi:hypothetical protein